MRIGAYLVELIVSGVFPTIDSCGDTKRDIYGDKVPVAGEAACSLPAAFH